MWFENVVAIVMEMDCAAVEVWSLTGSLLQESATVVVFACHYSCLQQFGKFLPEVAPQQTSALSNDDVECVI